MAKRNEEYIERPAGINDKIKLGGEAFAPLMENQNEYTNSGVRRMQDANSLTLTEGSILRAFDGGQKEINGETARD